MRRHALRQRDAQPPVRAHARTCRLRRRPRAWLYHATAHKRLWASLRAAAVEGGDELLVHLCSFFVQALRAGRRSERGAADVAVARNALRTSRHAAPAAASPSLATHGRTRLTFFFASSASLCSCADARERRAHYAASARVPHLKGVLLLDLYEGLLVSHQLTTSALASPPSTRKRPGGAPSRVRRARRYGGPHPAGPPSAFLGAAMAGVLRGTQLAQRLAPRAHGALAQRTRGFAAGACCPACVRRARA